jgi:putative ABC transport system permease protein
VFAEIVGFAMRAAQQGSMTGRLWLPEEFAILGLAVAVGALAALIPAWRAYRTDIAGTLARG